MAELKHGTVTILLPEGVEMPPNAGNLSLSDKRRLPKARKGLGFACNMTAAELEKSDNKLAVPGIDPTSLREAGNLGEKMDEIIEDLEVALETLKQANLLRDADAFNMLRKINDQVRSQSKFEPSIATRFASVTEYFSSTGRTAKSAEE